jgi:UrcA family protein
MVRYLSQLRRNTMFNARYTALRTVAAAFGTVIAAGICLAGAAAPAAAAEAPRVVTVSYSDLNLSSDAGRNAFDNRVKQAARSVCSIGSGDLRARADEARCIGAAINAVQVKPQTKG